MDRKLFVVTNRKLIKDGNLINVTEAIVKGGADAIILREKDLSSKELYSLAVKMQEVVMDRIPLVINGDYNVAVKCKADGIQLSYNTFLDFDKAYDKLKGVSIHSLEEAKKVYDIGANYVLAGHIFNTACKAGLPGRGIEFLNEICSDVSLPVIAIGGIELNNIDSILRAGAKGAALMSSVMEAENPEETVYNMKEAIDNY
ncbi:thiamine phosphate synthase [Clostridium pasteurianum]|uniref:Thiamine monophosphate synthase n=1 Tax=Clostridium pasteurianum BC1 TaxID=86416 RepID=R4K6P3_CLOPA|nr:thiamine phosphate synthase [Clostridium pasteurianum]AGK98857.1 thiamine monophosphate synthase [Clostridium pasteurianum BC1]